MLWLLDQAYRRLATGFALAFIFFGGGVLAVTVLPVAGLLPGARRERSQHIIQVIFRFYLVMLRCLNLVRLQIEGAERLKACRGKVIVANHPSLLDVVILMSLVRNAQCIIKSELWNHRFLGVLMRRAGYIRNDLPAEALVAACQEALDRGNNIIVFPEGTRSSPGSLSRLRRGFANIATLTNADVQLVVISCTPPMLMKGDPWWAIPERPSLFQVTVGHCIDSDTYLSYGQRSLASRRLTENVQAYFAEQLANV
jgi:1-acyl-sn-glycerol-3-phosphate acyltransferase